MCDYLKVNYLSVCVLMMESWCYFMGCRKVIVLGFVLCVFVLWLEEVVSWNIIILFCKVKYNFYEWKVVWCNVEWIGFGWLVIDGLKEVKEVVLRIEFGFFIYEKELVIMGEDY